MKQAICLLRRAEERVWDICSALNDAEDMLSKAIKHLKDEEEPSQNESAPDLRLAAHAEAMYQALKEVVYAKDQFGLFLAKEDVAALLDKIDEESELDG